QWWAATGEAAVVVRRRRATRPLQALTAFKEPVFLECARALGLKALSDGGRTDAERLTYAFRRCVARMPTADESAALLELLAKQKQRFTRPGAKPLELAAPDGGRLPQGGTAPDLAAWTVVARVLLNLDETVTKE